MSPGKVIVMLGTSPDGMGGIATVVKGYRDAGLLETWNVRYLITHRQQGSLIKVRAAASALLTLLILLLRGRVTLIHVHMSSRASTWRKSLFLLIAKFFGVPRLIHMHGGNYVDFFEEECGLLQRRLIRWMLRDATRVIVLSSGWRSDIEAIAPGARTVVLYNSVATPKLGGVLEARHAMEPPSILFLGRVTEPKGAFDLIRAMAYVRGNARLTMCGPGDIHGARALARHLGVETRVEFMGWVAGSEKERLLAQARIFVLPSHFEAMPMAVLEAMSWALPIVATAVGAIPEVVENGLEGLLVAPRNIEALADAMNRLIENPCESTKMGKAGRARIERAYTPAVLLPQLEAIWTSVA